MRQRKSGWLMGAVLLVGGAVQAQVVPRDLDGNGVALAFLDAASGLYWSVPDVVRAATFARASDAVGALEIEGRSDWRLPSLAEFQSLYRVQGQTGSAMTAAPFPAYRTWYWTTDVFGDNTGQNLAFVPGNTGAASPYFRTTEVGVWAVSAVPEPNTAGITAAGLLGLVAWRRRQARRG